MKAVTLFFVFTLMASVTQGSIIDTINAMPDNSWIRLPNNGPQPITRSASNVMHYDGDSVGYLWGTCHAMHHNDLWAFNISANRWREAQATEPSVTTDPFVIKNQDSIVMTREGRPLSFHQWSTMDFDSDRKKLWRCSYSGWQGLYSGHDSVICQYQPSPTCNAHTRCRVMGEYDPVTNTWSPVKFQPFSWPLTCSTCGEQYMVFRYVPYLKKFVCIVWGYYSNKYVLADPVNKTLQTVNVTLQPMGDNGENGSGMLGGAVWDSYREVLIFVGRGNTGTWAFDPKTMTMKQIVSVAGSPCVWTDCATSHMVYDSGNRCALVYTTPGMQQCYGGGTWPSRAAVYVLDYEGGKWDLLPAPPSGESPTNTSGSSGHGYFDQRLGVIFHFEGGYCANNGVRWLYKYKTPTGSGKEAMADAEEKGSISVSPNPFNPAVKIAVSGQRIADSKIQISIYNTSGKLAQRLSATSYQLSAGITWNAADQPSGLYLIRVTAGERTWSTRAFLMK